MNNMYCSECGRKLGYDKKYGYWCVVHLENMIPVDGNADIVKYFKNLKKNGGE